MSERCGSPLSIEKHVFACGACAALAERLAGELVAISRAVPPVLSLERFEALEREGRVAQLNVMAPGEVAKVLYPEAGKLLVHRLVGADLARARRVDVDLRTTSGESVGHLDDVPFDAARGELLLVCQRHFADSFPHDMTFAVEVVSGEKREEAARYTVFHELA